MCLISDCSGGKEAGGGDDRAVPPTKRGIVSLYLDRRALGHAGVCNAVCQVDARGQVPLN